MGILAWLCYVVSIVCWIMVLIKMFQNAGPLQGILGILCGIWAFIWGWMNSDKVGKNIMLAWTAAWILGAIFGYASGGFNYGANLPR